MARMTRSAGVLPLVGSVVAAAALAGVAVFTVSQAGCDTPGHYVESGTQVRLVGGCVGTGSLHPEPPADAQAGREPRP